MKNRLFAVLVCLTLLVTTLASCSSSPTVTAETTVAPTVETTAAPTVETTVPVNTSVSGIPISKSYDGLRVMIIGSGSPTYEVDRGQPSALVQYKGTYFVVDCGNRTSDTLLANKIPLRSTEYLFFTHQHFDHNSDFWDFFMGGSVIANPRLSLTIVGPDVSELLNTTLDYFKEDIDMRIEGLELTNDAAIYGTTTMDLTEETSTFELGGVKITTMKLPHGLVNYAYKFEADGQSIVISGDFLNEPKLADFAKDVDIFVVDAMLTSSFSFIPYEGIRESLRKTLEISHASGENLASIVANANAKQTVLTHLGGVSIFEESSKVFIAKGYTGKLMDAYDGLIIEPLKSE